MGEEKNKGKRREGKGREDKRKTLKSPSQGNLTLKCWADENEKKKKKQYGRQNENQENMVSQDPREEKVLKMWEG